VICDVTSCSRPLVEPLLFQRVDRESLHPKNLPQSAVEIGDAVRRSRVHNQTALSIPWLFLEESPAGVTTSTSFRTAKNRRRRIKASGSSRQNGHAAISDHLPRARLFSDWSAVAETGMSSVCPPPISRVERTALHSRDAEGSGVAGLTTSRRAGRWEKPYRHRCLKTARLSGDQAVIRRVTRFESQVHWRGRPMRDHDRGRFVPMIACCKRTRRPQSHRRPCSCWICHRTKLSPAGRRQFDDWRSTC